MKIRKKLLSLLGAAAMAVTVMAVAGGAQEVKAASNTYVVNSSVADVTGNVGDTIPVHKYLNSIPFLPHWSLLLLRK